MLRLAWKEDARGRQVATLAGAVLIVEGDDGTAWSWLVGCPKCRSINDQGNLETEEAAKVAAEKAASDWADIPDDFQL
jgi:hypothetical protein